MLKVLIVDDELIMRHGLRHIIDWEAEGYEIIGEASNGSEALELIKANQPHIIISDIVMPQMDGVDFSDIVHSLYPDIRMIILSGYDKFEYVKQTLQNGVVDYILKPTLNPKELRLILKKTASLILGTEAKGNESDKDICEFLKTVLNDNDEYALSELQKSIDSSYFVLYGVNIAQTDTQGISIRNSLSNIIKRELREIDLPNKYFFFPRADVACILFGFEMSKRSLLRIKLEKLNSHLMQVCPEIFGVISHTFCDLACAHNVFTSDILSYIDYGFYFENKHLLSLENEEGTKHILEKPKFDFSTYNICLLGKNFQEAATLLSEYHEKTLDARSDVYGIKNQMKNMLYMFLDSLAINDEMKSSLRYEIFDGIDNARYVSRYDDVIRQSINRLLELSGMVKNNKDALITSIISYIDQNYDKELSLETLAYHFGFNYNYFSSLFNQEMNESFSDYLNKVRIEKACELLKSTREPIADISSMVGYSEQSYFCRVFKKYTGVSPSGYRRTENEK